MLQDYVYLLKYYILSSPWKLDAKSSWMHIYSLVTIVAELQHLSYIRCECHS